jgi:DNA polymerase-3 subunit delta'
MIFQHVIGQKAIKEQLVHMVAQNRLSHALLFLGKEGVGALPMAIAFAQYINCEKLNGKKNNSVASPSLFGESAPVLENAIGVVNLADACGEVCCL